MGGDHSERVVLVTGGSGGAIINFSTTATRTNFPTYGAYVASKRALRA